MNGLNTDWLPVEAEAHQSWPPKKIKRYWQTEKQRKTEKERKKTKYIVIHKIAAEKEFTSLAEDNTTTDIKRGGQQWRRQLALRHVPPSTSNNFIFSSLWSKSDSQLSKYCVVCEISWCRCQQLTALSISTALVTKQSVIVQSAAAGPEVRRKCPIT